jgi:hypothetical protein
MRRLNFLDHLTEAGSFICVHKSVALHLNRWRRTHPFAMD